MVRGVGDGDKSMETEDEEMRERDIILALPENLVTAWIH